MSPWPEGWPAPLLAEDHRSSARPVTQGTRVPLIRLLRPLAPVAPAARWVWGPRPGVFCWEAALEVKKWCRERTALIGGAGFLGAVRAGAPGHAFVGRWQSGGFLEEATFRT